MTCSRTVTSLQAGTKTNEASLTSRLCKPLLGRDPVYLAHLEVLGYLTRSVGMSGKMRNSILYQ